MRLIAGIAALVAFAAAAEAAVAPLQVEIRQGEQALAGTLYRPAGDGPFPAVVGLHGCGGLKNSSGAVFSRYRDWADRLVTAGFAVLFPDTYGARGLGSQCAVRQRGLQLEHDVVRDAIAAREWLQKQAWIVPERVSLVGWSNGGVSALLTVRRQGAQLAGENGELDFRTAVAFYPNCRPLTSLAWSARVPTLILTGRADDSTPAAACEQMVRNARGRSAGVSIVVYPRAHHDFDHPNRAVHLRSGYAYSADGSGRVHTGTNAAARADALKRVPQWLAR